MPPAPLLHPRKRRNQNRQPSKRSLKPPTTMTTTTTTKRSNRPLNGQTMLNQPSEPASRQQKLARLLSQHQPEMGTIKELPPKTRRPLTLPPASLSPFTGRPPLELEKLGSRQPPPLARPTHRRHRQPSEPQQRVQLGKLHFQPLSRVPNE